MKITAYHGTNQTFEAFSLTPAVRSTHGASAASGIFFTSLHEVAAQYAHLAHGKLYAGDHESRIAMVAALVERSNRLSRAGRHDDSERLMEQAEQLETEARDEKHGARVITVEIDAARPLTIAEAGSIDLHKMRDVLEDAFTRGHDVVIFQNIWDPASIQEVSGPYDHIVIRDPSLARIVAVEELAPAEPAPSPTGP